MIQYCIVCGAEMTALRSTKLTCDDKCRQAKSRADRQVLDPCKCHCGCWNGTRGTIWCYNCRHGIHRERI